MSGAVTPEVTALPEVAQIAPNGPSERSYEPRTPLFTAEQQKAFDKAFSKREAKVRREFEEREATLRADIMELIWAAEQLLFKKLNRQQAQEIAKGLIEIKREYGPAEEGKCQRQ